MTTKPVKRVDLTKLNAEQRAALAALVRDAQAAAPQMLEARETARKVLQHLITSPTWTIAEAPRPDGLPQEGWSIGAPTLIDERPKT